MQLKLIIKYKIQMNDETQYSMLKKYELSESMHYELIKECKKYNIKFLSSPFDLGSIKLLNKLNLEQIKIPSSEITNVPYLELLGSYCNRNNFINRYVRFKGRICH